MIEWKEANEQLARAYNTRVPAYNLKPVLELISGVDPVFFVQTAAECIFTITDELMRKNKTPNVRTQNMLFTLKLIFRKFSEVNYEEEEFEKALDEQMANSEGCFAEEPLSSYNIL